MLCRHNGGVQLLISSLNSVCWDALALGTSLLLLLLVTCLAHLPPSSFTLRLTPTSHCASLTGPSKFSLSCLGQLRVVPSRSVSISSALQSSHCHLVPTSWPAVGTALSSRIFGLRPLAVFLCPSRPFDPRSSAHLLADSCTVSLSPIASCDRVTVSRSKHALQTLSSLCRFLVSARACLSRSFVSSRLVCPPASILW